MLEEPQSVPDLIGDAQPVMTHLVGLPQQRDLFGDPPLGVAPLARRQPSVVEPDELLRDADVGEQHGSPRRLGRVSGQDEADPRLARPCRELVARHRFEEPERILERLARDPAVVCVLATPAQAMVLLGEVRELEVEAERAQDERLRLRLEIVDRVGRRDGAVAPRLSRLPADAFDELEQVPSLLFDENLAQDRAEQPDVAAEWSGRVAHRGPVRTAGRVRSGRRPPRA